MRSLARLGGFTLVELLTVMAVIAILAGLILSISGFAQKKGALARAQAEIQALSSACESYKADNGTYPHQPLAVSGSIPLNAAIPSDSNSVDPRTQVGSAAGSGTPYMQASLELYEALTGDLTCSGTGGAAGTKNYIPDIKPDVLGRTTPTTMVSSANPVTYLSDPFGNSYGYSTIAGTLAASGSAVTMGYNPTFDLWSTGGTLNNPNVGSTAGQPGDPQLQWVKNW